MSSTDLQLQQLLDALAAHVGMESLKLGEDHVCRLVLDEELVIDIECQPGEPVFQVYCAVGPHPGDDVRLCHRLLAANLFGQGTGGAVLALDEDRGETLLCQPFHLEHVNPAGFIAGLESFFGFARAWTEAFDAADFPEDAEEMPASEGGPFIRV